MRCSSENTTDVVCLGETMLMFAPPRYELIEHCDRFTTYSAGSESNVAIGLARLGIHSGWIGKLPDNVLGRKIVNGIRAHGVDTSRCIWTKAGRVGTVFVEWGACPRPLKTIYDRAGSTAATLKVDELDWDYLKRAEWLHLSGITPALSEMCRESTAQIVSCARKCGCRISFDVNYRSLLWSPDEARTVFQEILPNVDLLIATEADATMLLEQERAQKDLAQKELVREMLVVSLFDRYHPDAAVMTCGADGSMAYDGQDIYRSRGYDVHAVNCLGAGDAFDAGFLYGYLNLDLQSGLDCGSVMTALKMTIPQNMPLIERADLQRILSGNGLDVLR
ncbi:MAG: sugar kinase [Anaerolineae bacterium]|nr:sugar kinase [Anaerolineae bacterium]